MKIVTSLNRSSGSSTILPSLTKFLLLMVASAMSPSYGATGPTSPVKLSGFIEITNKGISTVSKRTLGEPAAMVGLSVSGDKLSFEPRLRWSLEDGKPWVFAFWWRYQLRETNRFHLSAGVYPSLSFKKYNLMQDGERTKHIETRRFVGGDLRGSYQLSKKFGVNFRYLYRRGVESWLTKHTNYMAVGARVSGIEVTERINLAIQFQPSYLRSGREEDIYASAHLTLSSADFPVSLTAGINQAVDIESSGEKRLWNISLRHRFEL